MNDYEMTQKAAALLDSVFVYHKPISTQPERYEALRVKAKEFASFIYRNTPESREQSLAITNIQQAVMFANAAIAIHEKETDQMTSGDPA